MSAGTITVGRHPLTAVGPQAEAGRYSSTQPLAGGRLGSMYTVTDRISASIDVSLTTAIRPRPYKYWRTQYLYGYQFLDINYHLQSYVMDRSMVVFFKFRRVLKK